MNCKNRNYSCSLRISHPVIRTTHANLSFQQLDLFPGALPEPSLANILVRQGILNRTSGISRPHLATLLQHFSNATVTSLGFGPTPRQAWCTAIPVLTLKHNFVIHGVLAVASLHLAELSGDVHAKDNYRNVAAAELNTGLVQYMSEIRSVTKGNAEALFAFSTIVSLFTSFQATAECHLLLQSMDQYRHTARATETQILEMTNITCRRMRTLRGAQIILVPGWPQLQDGPLQAVVKRESWSADISVAQEHSLDDQNLRHLESMWANPQRTYQDYFATLRQTWQSLRESFALIWKLMDASPLKHPSSGPYFDWTSIFHWPVQCSLAYIALLEQQCIEAWVLLAHYAILLAKVEGLWWLESSAVSVVKTAALVVGTENWKWIAWPAAETGVDLEDLRLLALTRQSLPS
jgi:hypothetical protein